MIGRTDLDCWECVQEMDLTIPDYTALMAGFDQVNLPQKGDVVLMEKVDDEYPFHAGYMVDSDSFIHATRKMGVIRGYIYRWPYKGKIIGFYRWRGGNGQED